MDELLYDGSPVQMRSRDLYLSAREEGKPVMKGKAIAAYESPSPNSKLISHSSSSVTALADLAEADDIDGLLQKLNKPILTPVERIVKVLANSINNVDKLLADRISNVELRLEISTIGTSPLVLSFECFKQVESGLSPFYKEQICTLQDPVLTAFGKVIKTFQKSQLDTFVPRITGDDVKVCAKVEMGTFGAALYHFVKYHSLYKEGSVIYNSETAKALAAPLLQSYCSIMEKYVKSLPHHTEAMTLAAADPCTVKEWHAFYKMRMERDHKGGYCAAWRVGYPEEAARLTHVKNLFSRMIEVQMAELDSFPVLKQCVVPNMDNYIAKKQAQESKKRPAAGISFDELNAVFREWGHKRAITDDARMTGPSK